MYMCMRRYVRNGRRTDEEGGGGEERRMSYIRNMAVGLMREREEGADEGEGRRGLGKGEGRS